MGAGWAHRHWKCRPRLRNIRSAAAGSIPPAPRSAAPAAPHRTADTAPPQTRRSGSPPALGSSADRTGDSPPSPAKPAESTSPLVALDPFVSPSPCQYYRISPLYCNTHQQITLLVLKARPLPQDLHWADFCHGLLGFMGSGPPR